ncbi:hypothetical protein RHSIM_Rhsim03G0039700 [Rhododendron simsii]|uniref:Uncharacterized protein n=1 Tax=Rhododendron simsii TaxID=118357 RepID=A0A834LSW8_RHOSS|nr:hypothetical protein RHSIM_Rhsim03G0039700 [Rhododendron simsii]
MGQSLMKFAPGSEENKAKEIGPIIESCYDTYFSGKDKIQSSADFFQAVCETIGEINKKLGSTQFRVPKSETLRQVYEKHHQGKGKTLTKEEFQKILQDVVMESGVSGIGAKDLILYIFGVPVTALFIKQRIIPGALPNEIFIPVITSATVFVLAKLNKI